MTLKDEGQDTIKDSTKKREAYFIEFAGVIRALAAMPVMVTGGFRIVAGMLEAIENGELDIVGPRRPMIADPDVPRKILAGEIERTPTPAAGMHPFHILGWNNTQLIRLGDAQEPDLAEDPAAAAGRFATLEVGNIAAYLDARRAISG